jgi:hypothetical protein
MERGEFYQLVVDGVVVCVDFGGGTATVYKYL